VEIAPDNWHADHVIPVAFGGESTLANGQALCVECNAAKGRLEAKMALRADKMGGRVGQQARREKAKASGKPRLQSRGFDKTLRRKMDGSVERRET
jgi:hypothetical protein